MPIADSHQSSLRNALVAAVETKRARQRRRAIARRVALATLAIAVVVAGVVTITLPRDRASASLEVTTRDGSVFVRLLDFENRPDEIVGALRNAGIAAEVDPLPVGPSNVGRFVGYSSPQGVTLKVTDGTDSSFDAFSVPQDFAGQLRLSLGRAAAPGEQWSSSSNAMAKGEALSCRNLYKLTASEAAARLAGVSATITWLAIPGGTLAPGAELAEPYRNWRVIDALSPAEGTAVMRITADGSWPYLSGAPPQIDPSCKGK